MPNLKFLLRQLSQFLQTDRYLCHKQTEDLRQQIQAELPRTWLKVLTAYWLPQRFWQYLVLRWRLKQLESKRQCHNLVFVQREVARQSEFFDHVAKFPLDQQQRLAVVVDEDNNLVIAGAGSGKTMTIVAKVRYLVEILGVPAEQILPISFTHKSAAEMTNRIAVEGIKPQTFHKFGLSVVQQTEGRRPDIFNEADSNQTLRSFLKQAMTDETYLVKLNQFLVKYLKIPKSQFEFKTLGEYIQYLKDQNFTTYKVITYSRMKKSAQQRQTFKNETVKSIEICQIANFLLLNGIKYNYEKPYEAPADGVSPKVTYRPDFTIKTKSGMVYIDHLQLNRRGYVPSFLTRPHETPEIAKRRYQKTLLWKRRLHRQNKTTLIETTSYDFYDHQLFQRLEKNLRQAGVEFKPLSPLEQWELIKKSGRDQIDEFLGLVKTFLALLKSNGYTIQQARCFNRQKSTNNFLKRRAALFIDLFEVIYQKYQAHLEQADQIDFNDMITKATDYIQSGRYYCPLQYVIIDEFQDLSFGRYRILEAIRTQNPAVKFYCVGDDWQSIFRFAGSDVTLFSQFEQFFGCTSISRIETTYRFNQPLIGLSSTFILKNPHQLPKTLKSPADKPPTTYQIIESDNPNGDDTKALVEAFKSLLAMGATFEHKIYLIGRYNFDLKRIIALPNQLEVDYRAERVAYQFSEEDSPKQQLEAEFITAHKSKGLEADYIILINCNSGKYGFPSGQADDPILSLLLSSADQFADGEERRLFYVAMTRAKKAVIFLTNKYRKSKFIRELQQTVDDSTHSPRCPKCGDGELVKRYGPHGEFYGCTNWEFGCDYTTNHLPRSE